jgi:hypothetical protein
MYSYKKADYDTEADRRSGLQKIMMKSVRVTLSYLRSQQSENVTIDHGYRIYQALLLSVRLPTA